jgi:hypothetical protein
MNVNSELLKSNLKLKVKHVKKQRLGLKANLKVLGPKKDK